MCNPLSPDLIDILTAALMLDLSVQKFLRLVQNGILPPFQQPQRFKMVRQGMTRVRTQAVYARSDIEIARERLRVLRSNHHSV